MRSEHGFTSLRRCSMSTNPACTLLEKKMSRPVSRARASQKCPPAKLPLVTDECASGIASELSLGTRSDSRPTAVEDNLLRSPAVGL